MYVRCWDDGRRQAVTLQCAVLFSASLYHTIPYHTMNRKIPDLFTHRRALVSSPFVSDLL